MVVKNIQNMRTQMIESIKDNQLGDEPAGQLKHEFSDLSNIIEPQKFLERHYPE